MMLPFSKPTIYQSQKCYATYGKMCHIDPRQPPSKGKPWTALAGLDFIYQVSPERGAREQMNSEDID
jgi:ribonucleases P/MRP protein subunit RPP40